MLDWEVVCNMRPIDCDFDSHALLLRTTVKHIACTGQPAVWIKKLRDIIQQGCIKV